MLHALAEFDPWSVRLYKWGYALEEIEELYRFKVGEYIEKREADYKFLVELASAALGGKKADGEYELDDGDGIEELDPEQIAAMRQMLGDDFERIYGEGA